MSTRSTIAVLVAGLLTLPASALLRGATGRAQVAQPASHAPAASADPVDGGWPRAYITKSGARFLFYAPQVASWDEQKHIVMYAAVSYTPEGQQAPALGTLRIEADTKIAVDERLVSFSDFKITATNFPTLSRDQLTPVVDGIMSAVPKEERVIALDRVLAAMDATAATAIAPKNVKDVKVDPPVIFFSQTPAVLVNIDGDPIWSPINGNDLRFAVNTNWDLFEHAASKTYYLRTETAWMNAPSVDGPWTPAATLPDSFAKLPNDDNWKGVKAALSMRYGGAPPTVFLSRTPAELILLTGAPAFKDVSGTRLRWVSNTDSDVFRAAYDGPIYFLVSGRWFSAPGFHGPWTFATPNLPEDFKHIPLEHPRSRVLASVPGTTQALEAVLLAQVPQTARVGRTTAPPDVLYQGDPQFEAIGNLSISRAVNTDKDVLKVGDRFYLCVDAVWFVGDSPHGPWTVADSIPKEIYTIPISSPAYNVTNVTIESSDDDAVVFAADAAYDGLMVGWGCAMWGTGWYYPPYYWGGGYYPVYFPRYPSYGYGARYNPWTGTYTRAGAVYGPYGGAGYAARYNTKTGTYSRGVAAWGPAGVRGAAEAWNPRTGAYGQTRQGSNVFGSWGATSVQRGDQWAKTARITNRATGTTTRATQGTGGGGAVTRRGPDGGSLLGKTGAGDVYAGRDGNVYRNTGEGWQKFDKGGWSSAGSSATREQLNQDRSARADGAQRTKDLGTVRSQAGTPRGNGMAGTYRPSGGGTGGSRGGGGFRGGGGGGRR